ncbi:MAG TPA: biotin-dependent carboxyltransferase family protein [Gemmataceae bacterium]|nr:biotin-dependent carboxyltransferase family protein [Gemmataceae bacterium]
MSLLVLDPGIDSRIVDLGRPRTRSLGVPVGGAADRHSFLLGNALLGNAADAPAIEFALKGPRLRADADVGCVVFGAPFDIFRGDNRIEAGRTFALRAGQELRIGGTPRGMRAYLCVRGGFEAPTILASRSGLEPIRGNDVLRCPTSAIGSRWCAEVQCDFAADVITVHALPGLQASWFDDADFYDQEFTVSPASNRMGLRLKGAPLTMPKREMVSEPVAPGAVQVTNDGQCIILGVDGQTIGGYPKIAHVIDADLDLLGQMRPGQRVRFLRCTISDAVEMDRTARAELRRWTLRLENS